MLEELRAEPRKETLDVTVAQVQAAQASLKTATDELDKQQAAYTIDPRSISKDALDSAINAKAVAETNLEVARRQYALTKAGAWIYDINNQERQYTALQKAYAASSALLSKYTLRAAHDGVVLSINTVAGAYVSPQGAYDTYTQAADPVLVLSNGDEHLNLRCVRRRNPGSTSSPAIANQGAYVHPRNQDGDPAHLRSHSAFRFAKNRAVESTAGAGRCEGAADYLPGGGARRTQASIPANWSMFTSANEWQQ